MILNLFWPLFIALYGLMMPFSNQQVTKNGMTVKWHFENDRVHFKMCGPAQGWLAIGFNEKEDISDTYLIMGNIVNNSPNVVEYYTIAPGHYQSVVQLGANASVADIKGMQTNRYSELSFSLPVQGEGQYQKSLMKGEDYHLIMAYSAHHDFQHHSRMRTSVKIQL